MEKKVIIHYKKKRIKIIAKDCNILQKFIGLMFSRRDSSKILLFKFKKKQRIRIHSMFVFYPFVAVWLDKKNKIVDLKIVKPLVFCISPKKDSYGLVEIPISSQYKKLLKNSIFRRELETFK